MNIFCTFAVNYEIRCKEDIVFCLARCHFCQSGKVFQYTGSHSFSLDFEIDPFFADNATGMILSDLAGKDSDPHTIIVKGDGKMMSIAAASVLAKTYRDDFMNRIAEEYPQYDWLENKGYPTKKHRDAIKLYGTTPYHRMSFNLLGDGQLSFDF